VPSLSTPIGELKPHYGVVVVGSGYGASVAAYRMAALARELAAAGQKSFSVCVLERGLEIAAGDYPSSLTQVAQQMQVDTEGGRFGARTALFDLHLNRDVGALVGCGLGGGSLINAGVMIEPLKDVFDRSWPADIQHEGLLPYFRQVRREIRPVRVPARFELTKVTELLRAAKAPLVWSHTNHPSVAVSFRTRVNRHQVQQTACTLCGDCMTGCNHSAKNTLVTNYLPAAANEGAAIFCRMDVRAIERRHGRWHLQVRVLNAGFRTFGSPELSIEADTIFLGAGTLGSVEILLRSAKRGLPLSRALGKRFSGNGDVIAFAYNAQEPVNGFGYGSYVPPEAAVGPLIGGMLDERRRGVMIQEGTVPGALKPLLRFAAPLMARVSQRPIDLSADVRFRFFRRELDTILRGAHHGALRRTQTFLGMGVDKARGQMRLRRDRLRIDWPRAREAGDHAIQRVTRRMSQLTRGMKGRYLVNPFWSRVFGRRRVTVHPLGGARMADDARRGVVNADGRVFKHDSGRKVYHGLYVCDGAVVPRALGANPALTIAALAERIASRAFVRVRRRARGRTENAAPQRIDTAVPGIQYAERLRGRIHLDGKQSRFTLVLHISAENLRHLIEGADHRASVVGVLTAPGLKKGHRRLMVHDGTFSVMVDDPLRVDSKLVTYSFNLRAADGTTFHWFGEKTINYDTMKRRGLWAVVSSYDFTIKSGSRIVGRGTARSSVLDAIRMSASMRITHARTRLERLRLRHAYRSYFVTSVLRVVVRTLTSMPRTNPLAGSKRTDVLQALQYIEQVDEIRDRKFPERPRYTLTAYRWKDKEPRKGSVILAPGFGMSADAFLLKDSLAKRLCKEGYRVWLLDYRASDRLAASLEQFTIDDLAIGDGTLDADGVKNGTITGDFPDAVRDVVNAGGGAKVQIVAHCVASLTVFMALLARTLTEEHVQSVILSQSFACIDHPWINRFKAWIRLPQVLRYFRFMTVMSPDYDLRSGWKSRLLDRVLRVYPTNERCSSGVCRRLLLMYGEVIRHDQLTKETHDLLFHLFDRANLTTFVHLSRMISKGQIVDRHGRKVYLTPQNIERLRVPMTLLQGRGNRLFRRRGADRTIRWLHTHGNKNLFRLEVIRGHGHLDTFIGRHAKRAVHPPVCTLLDTGARATVAAD
jgi:cholesterol oxidase